MSEHTEIRLETTGGTVIAYFAPNFEVQPLLDNDLKGQPLPRGDPSVIRDLRLIQTEITVQGAFEDSDELPAAHKSDLESLFGKSPVTARDQVRRIRRFMQEDGGPFVLYEGADEYSAQTASAVDRANGVYPTVNVKQFRPPSLGGHSRYEYMVKMKVGMPRIS